MMEIANNALYAPLETRFSNSVAPFQCMRPEQYLSREEACELLEEDLKKRKATYIKIEHELDNVMVTIPHGNPNWGTAGISMKTILSITLFATTFISLYAAILTVISEGFNGNIVQDHSKDVITPYYCPAMKSQCPSCISPEGFWIQPSAIGYVSLTPPTLYRALEVALIPPCTMALLIKFTKCTYTYFVKMWEVYKQKQAWQEQEPLYDMKIRIRHCSSEDQAAPLEAPLISKLLDFQLTLPWGELSFQQIREIKLDHPVHFQTALRTNAFAERQQLYWNKLQKMTKVSPMKLLSALQNQSNRKVFIQEPHVLETLLQQLPSDRLEQPIKEVLARCLSEISTTFDALDRNIRLQVIEIISGSKCSFAKALRRAEVAEFASESATVALHFNREAENETISLFHSDGQDDSQSQTLEVSRWLLCQLSPVLNAQLGEEGKFKEAGSTKHHIQCGDLETFAIALQYAKTGELDLHERHIQSLAELVDYYQMDSLKQELETHLCIHLSFHVHDPRWADWLELAGKFNFYRFHEALDEKFETDLKHREDLSVTFIDNLQQAIKYELQSSSDYLLRHFSAAIQDGSTQGRYIQLAIESVKKQSIHMDFIFALFVPLFDEEPKLLKLLWERAKAEDCSSMLAKIVEFCQDPSNAHIHLANWAIRPGRALEGEVDLGEGEVLLEMKSYHIHS